MQIQFPVYIGEFNDYHEFSYVVALLKKLGIRGVKYTETGYKNGYGAVFYLKKDAEYKRLISKHEEFGDE